MSREDMQQQKQNISVLMSVYEKENPKYLGQALASILNQTMKPQEIVLIEDGRLTDELYQVIEAYVRQAGSCGIEINRYRFDHSVQLGRALSKGVTLCRNALIARMDTDDIAVETRLEQQAYYLSEHSEVSVLGGAILEFSDDGSYEKVKNMPIGHSDIKKYARYRNPVNHMTVMFRRDAVLRCGNYRHFPYLEDYELWSRMIAAGEIFDNLTNVQVKARTNNGVYGRRGGWKYFQQYLLLRREQKELQLLTGTEYIKAVILTFGMTMQPNRIRKWIYQKVLRKNVRN